MNGAWQVTGGATNSNGAGAAGAARTEVELGGKGGQHGDDDAEAGVDEELGAVQHEQAALELPLAQ